MDQTWYQDFVADENLSREMLFDLLTAANFLGIKPLLDLTCLKVTFQLTGKNAEEVRISVRLDCTI
jgi:S-phase kinase-associated protein 1